MRDRETQRGRSCEYEADVGGQPRMPKIAIRHQRLGERHEIGSPLEPPEGTHPAHTLISDFGLPELFEN